MSVSQSIILSSRKNGGNHNKIAANKFFIFSDDYKIMYKLSSVTDTTLMFYAIKESICFRGQKYHKHETGFLFLICNHPFKGLPQHWCACVCVCLHFQFNFRLIFYTELFGGGVWHFVGFLFCFVFS